MSFALSFWECFTQAAMTTDRLTCQPNRLPLNGQSTPKILESKLYLQSKV